MITAYPPAKQNSNGQNTLLPHRTELMTARKNDFGQGGSKENEETSIEKAIREYHEKYQ